MYSKGALYLHALKVHDDLDLFCDQSHDCTCNCHTKRTVSTIIPFCNCICIAGNQLRVEACTSCMLCVSSLPLCAMLWPHLSTCYALIALAIEDTVSNRCILIECEAAGRSALPVQVRTCVQTEGMTCLQAVLSMASVPDLFLHVSMAHLGCCRARS